MTHLKFHKHLILLHMLLLTYSSVMAQNEYSIKIDLPHSKEDVWKTITDFSSYTEWNSVLVMKDNDELKIGEKFKVTIMDEKGKKSSFKAKTLTRQEYSSFSARQTVIGKWFFSATHYFIIEEKNDSETTFIQKWEFSGILYRPFKKMIFKQLNRFNQMNEDLNASLSTP